MKTEVFLKVDDSQASVKVNGKITAKAVGIPVHVSIEGDRWEGLATKLVASCEKVNKEAAIIDGIAILPWECLISKKRLYIGVDGTNPESHIRIPTMWAFCGEVESGVGDVEADNSTDPTPEMVDQILWVAQSAGQIAASIQNKADNHEFDGFSPEIQVVKTSDGHSVIVQDRNGVKSFNIKDGVDGESPKVYVESVNGKTGKVLLGANDIDGFSDVAMSGSYNDLSETPDIPERVSELINDSGYITEEFADDRYAVPDDIPEVPEWAMQPTKPSYTASEVGTYPVTVLTQEEYDSIAIKDRNMIYFIAEE